MLITLILMLISSVVTLLGLNEYIIYQLRLSIPKALVLLVISAITAPVPDMMYGNVLFNYYFALLLVLSLMNIVKMDDRREILITIIGIFLVAILMYLYVSIVDKTLYLYSLYFVFILAFSAFLFSTHLRNIVPIISFGLLIFEIMRYSLMQGDNGIFCLGGEGISIFAFVSIYIAIILKFLLEKIKSIRYYNAKSII